MDPMATDGTGGVGLILSGAALVFVLTLLFKTKLFDDKDKLSLVKFVAGFSAIAAAILAEMPSTNGFVVALLGRVAIFFFVYYFVSIVFGFFVAGASESANKKK